MILLKGKVFWPCGRMHYSMSVLCIDIGSLSGRCFFLLSLGKARIQDGTLQPEATITLAMLRKNGTSASVYNVIASPLLPALPERPNRKKIAQFYLSKLGPNTKRAAGICRSKSTKCTSYLQTRMDMLAKWNIWEAQRLETTMDGMIFSAFATINHY